MPLCKDHARDGLHEHSLLHVCSTTLKAMPAVLLQADTAALQHQLTPYPLPPR